MLTTILIVILILALLGALPTWGYSRGWGYGPGGGIGLILIIVMILVLTGHTLFGRCANSPPSFRGPSLGEGARNP